MWNSESESWTQLNDSGEGRVAGTQFSVNGKGYILVVMEMITIHLIMVSFGNITLTQTHGQNYHCTPVVLDGHLDLLFLDVMYILLAV